MNDDEINERKLSANLRKAKERRDKASETVAELDRGSSSKSRRGIAEIRRASKALKKAEHCYSLAKSDDLDRKIDHSPVRPRRPRL